MDDLSKYCLVAQRGLQTDKSPLNESKALNYNNTIKLIIGVLDDVAKSYDNGKLAYFVCISALEVIEKGLKRPEYFTTSEMVGGDEYDILKYTSKTTALGFLNDEVTLKWVSDTMDFRSKERDKIFKSNDFRIAVINVLADVVAQECYHMIRNTLGDEGLESRNHQILPHADYTFH